MIDGGGRVKRSSSPPASCYGVWPWRQRHVLSGAVPPEDVGTIQTAVEDRARMAAASSRKADLNCDRVNGLAAKQSSRPYHQK
jgi:hypothetical protein